MIRRLWRVAKAVLLGVLALLLAALASGFAYRTYRHRHIAAATVVDPVKGIDEELFAPIGGIEQWVSIRGQDRGNPVLLLVHGGPGLATSPYPRDFLFGWTKDFTLVQWAQRGAGKTFGRSGPIGPEVTIDRMALDGVEVAEFLRRKLHQPKIILVGHSWGTMLGVRMVRARPDLFYAYVGTGQAVNQGKSEPIAYAQLLAEARARRDRRALRELGAIGPPPYDSISKEADYSKWADAYEAGGLSRLSLIATILFDSEANFGDIRDYAVGLTTSADHFRRAVGADDLPSLGTDFATPFFVFQGAEDNVTPVSPVRSYMDGITAPRKELVLIPNAGHNVISTRSDEFLKLLLDRVRPLSLDRAR